MTHWSKHIPGISWDHWEKILSFESTVPRLSLDSKSFQLKDFVEVMSSPYFLRKLQSVANMLDAQCVLAQCLLVLKTRQIFRQITISYHFLSISLPLRSTENCLVRISFSCRCQAGSGYAANVRLAGCEPAGRVALANLLCLELTIWRTNSTSASVPSNIK